MPPETDRQSLLERRLAEVRARIGKACAQAGRAPGSVTLLAVGKTRDAAELGALQALGQRAFGENYVDEALAKQRALAGRSLKWHFIGPLQSNKTRAVAEHFDWVQSVDRARIVRRLGTQRPEGHPPLNVLLQVNIDAEPHKAGCPPEALDELAGAVSAHAALSLRGLMAIPRPAPDASAPRPAFERMQALFERLRGRYDRIDTLSIGMSGDLEAAIAAGSTMVRIGTALFGPRPGGRRAAPGTSG